MTSANAHSAHYTDGGLVPMKMFWRLALGVAFATAVSSIELRLTDLTPFKRDSMI